MPASYTLNGVVRPALAGFDLKRQMGLLFGEHMRLSERRASPTLEAIRARYLDDAWRVLVGLAQNPGLTPLPEKAASVVGERQQLRTRAVRDRRLIPAREVTARGAQPRPAAPAPSSKNSCRG
jgi:hypothetical protein